MHKQLDSTHMDTTVQVHANQAQLPKCNVSPLNNAVPKSDSL